MKLGIATVDSTPPVGTYLGGYSRMRGSSHVRDRLRTTALAFESDGGGALLLAVDLVFIHEDLVARIAAAVAAATGVSNERVVINASHSHSTPYGWTGEFGVRHHRLYHDRLVDHCLRAATEAWDARIDSALTLHRGATGININRRMPQPNGLVDFGWNEVGTQDRTLRALQAHDQAGRLRATIVNLACHPIVLPPRSRAISADWVGAMRTEVERETGAPCVFLQGACADINPRHEWGEDDEAASDRLGARAAADVLDAVSGDTAELLADGPIDARAQTVWLPLEAERDPNGTGDLPYWRGILRDKALPKWVVDALLSRAFPWRVDWRVADDGRPEVPLAIHALRVGGLCIASHGSEAFHQTGIAVRERSPTAATLFCGYTNGMIGYVPPAIDIPLRGYEVDTVPYLYRLPGRFSPEGEPKAVEATLALIEAMFG